ncbi:unnamed protein product [Brassica napus]|uniref:(rape) hypothetical protein n=1 Tax=Brassica napus TaxID=3708 RepID=A0A816TIZ6_BRANA|nr:unnamed protein product [Brassica napus]
MTLRTFFIQQLLETSREQSSEPPPQNFFNDLSKAPTADAEASTKPLWVEDKAMKEAGSSKIKEEARVDMH